MTIDPEFEDVVIAKVGDGDAARGWQIERADGWSFFVPGNSPVEPKVGMTARFYGPGIGYPVRGLFLAGREVFYRTEAEEKDYRDAESYGATVDDLLRKWDEGGSIWSVELGGLGPGYEQAIQIMAVEFARAGREMPRTTDEKADYAAFDSICTLALKPIDADLGGVSGAQYGQAKWLAWQWCFGGGPMALMRRAREQKDTRTIQVRKYSPKAPEYALPQDRAR